MKYLAENTWLLPILAAVVLGILAFSCAGTKLNLGYSDRQCTGPEESVPGALIQECYVDPVSGFAQCRYRVVHTPLSCECREWWIRLTCDGNWSKFKRTCHCGENDLSTT